IWMLLIESFKETPIGFFLWIDWNILEISFFSQIQESDCGPSPYPLLIIDPKNTDILCVHLEYRVPIWRHLVQQHVKQKDRIDPSHLVDNGPTPEISIDDAK